MKTALVRILISGNLNFNIISCICIMMGAIVLFCDFSCPPPQGPYFLNNFIFCGDWSNFFGFIICHILICWCRRRKRNHRFKQRACGMTEELLSDDSTFSVSSFSLAGISSFNFISIRRIRSTLFNDSSNHCPPLERVSRFTSIFINSHSCAYYKTFLHRVCNRQKSAL